MIQPSGESTPCSDPVDVPLRVQGLVAGYAAEPVLDGVDLCLERGRRILLLGPNGAGKTTLLRCILGLLPSRSGSIRLWGLDPSDPVRRAGLVARCGVGLDAPRSGSRVTTGEWLGFHATLAGSVNPSATAALAMEQWNIPGGRMIEELSLGERQRLETSRALLHEPKLLLLDEPTAHLDPGARDEFWSCLDSWCAPREASVLVSTHQLEEAADRGYEWVVLGRGKVLHRGPSDSFVQSFPCSRRLIVREATTRERLQETMSMAIDGAQVVSLDASDTSFRIRSPNGRQDLPAIIDRLSREGVAVMAIGEDSTSYREAYASCLGLGTRGAPRPPSLGTATIASWWTASTASAWLHVRGLARERRLMLPFVIMLAVLAGAVAWMPSQAFTTSLLALGAVLPGGLVAGLAADLVAGERERRTLETSLSLPVPFRWLILGRALAISLPGIVLSWLALAVIQVASRTPLSSDPIWIGVLLSPAAISFCATMGTWVSTKSVSHRAAAQLSTLSSLPLIALAQAMPILVGGSWQPWLVPASVLWTATALLAYHLASKLQPNGLRK